MHTTNTLPLETIQTPGKVARLRLNQPRRVLITALALGWSVDFFFYGKPLGISLAIFVALLLAALLGLGWLEGKRPSPHNFWLVIPLIFFAVMVFMRANAFLTTLNVLAVLALLSYLAFFYAAGRVDQLNVLGALLTPLRTGMHSLVLSIPLLRASVDLPNARAHGRRNLFPLLRGLLLALPILLVLGGLLASADLIFANYVEQALHLEFLADVQAWIWRLCLMAGAAWLLAGGLVYALAWRETAVADKSALEELVEAVPRYLSLGFIESMVVLVLVNTLFLTFVSVQFAYLFGGERQISLEGYTYAEYARRGFFELVAVAVLTFALVMWLNWLTRRENKRQLRLFNWLGSGMVALVLVLLASAWQRMRLYELTFGYTELRLQVYVFMAWLAVALLWFLLTLWAQRRAYHVAIGLIISAIGFLVTLNALNPDALIVRHNLNHYRETGELDAVYLSTLSDDALPELLRALPQVAGDAQLVATSACHRDGAYSAAYAVEACAATLQQILTANLNGRYQARLNDTSWQQWQSFHLSRQRAFADLSAWAGGD